ncbi:hypothetical protein FSC37_12435 [Piscinibacter aquaticus]|uniref:PAS fold-4 domain-containing protein n=1 Tax=Piscinibacter aquaticus TaxID=392597 RepID=A0A5C6U1D8_9BURK|nr:hypothetical protein FSC37_12435 [Piscinibacter aquaticus]
MAWSISSTSANAGNAEISQGAVPGPGIECASDDSSTNPSASRRSSVNERSGSTDDLGALAPWAQELAQTFVSLSSDIALVLDESGVIRSVAQSGAQPMAPAAAEWVGRPWADTVATPMRRKVEALLNDVTSTGLARRREISHSGAGGADIPVAYTAIRLGRDGPVIAVGRDLRAIAAIQQRFLDAQQDLERGYWKARGRVAGAAALPSADRRCADGRCAEHGDRPRQPPHRAAPRRCRGIGRPRRRRAVRPPLPRRGARAVDQRAQQRPAVGTAGPADRRSGHLQRGGGDSLPRR